MIIDAAGNKWFKGNPHTHTTRSDGRLAPDTVIRLYRDKGYDFMALTDHWAPSETQYVGDFLILSGCEYDLGSHAPGIYHIVGLGFGTAPALAKGEHHDPQELINGIRDAGGLAYLAHPAWSMNRPTDILRLSGLSGMEIYNSVSGRPWNARPYSGWFADALALEGTLLPCTAADDCHFYNGDETLSYVMVKAESLAPGHILDAMRRGDLYATQGPELYVERHGDTIRVTCSPVEDIVFFTDSVYAIDRVTRGHGITEAEYRIKPADTFVRVEAFDAVGSMAWTSPMSLKQ